MPDLHKGEIRRGFKHIIVDGMNLAYRCFYTIPTKFKGKKSGIFFGFLNKMIAYRLRNPESKIYVLWEGEGENRRKQILSTYKGNRLYAEHRSDVPNDFQENVRDVREALPLMSVFQYQFDSLEADDIAHFLCSECELSGSVLLVTNDTDWHSFLRPGVFIEDKRGIMDYGMVERKIGYPPDKTILFKSVRGCRTDNVEQAIDRIKDSELASVVTRSRDLSDLIRNLKEHGNFSEEMIRVNNSVVSFYGDLIKDDPGQLQCVEPKKDDEKLNNLLLKWGCFSLKARLGIK